MNALPVLPVLVRNPHTMAEVKAYALLDSGSTDSFCSSEIATKPDLYGHSGMLTLPTLGAECAVVKTTSVSLEVCNIVLGLSEVFIRDKLSINLSNRATPQDIQIWPHLQDIDLP